MEIVKLNQLTWSILITNTIDSFIIITNNHKNFSRHFHQMFKL